MDEAFIEGSYLDPNKNVIFCDQESEIWVERIVSKKKISYLEKCHIVHEMKNNPLLQAT